MAAEPLKIAVIGSGPAGYYTAEALTKDNPDCVVEVLDKLPTPFGLIRGGVAPDHQSIKGVSRRYEKTAFQDNVRFIGNVNIGKDITVTELMDLFDAVVLTTGAPHDRKLNIPGDNKLGVVGSSAFVGWYNSHPDHAGLAPDLNVDQVAVIGNGNVAVDVARVLAKTAAEMSESDLASYAANAIHPAPLTDIYMFGRRGPMESSFTPKELGELGELERAVPVVDPAQMPDDLEAMLADEPPARKKIMTILDAYTANTAGSKPITLHLAFFARPVEVLGDERVTGLRLEKTRVEDGQCIGTGEFFEVPCRLLVPCIGYRSDPLAGVPFDEKRGHFTNTDGKISDRLYVAGWARRGPTGTIGTNRPDGIEVATRISQEVTPKSDSGGRDALLSLLADRGVKPTTFRDWKKIEEAETAAARGPAPRTKFHSIDQMMKAISGRGD